MIIDVSALEATRAFYIEMIKNGLDYNQEARQLERDYVQGYTTLEESIKKLKGGSL